jgi:sterol desaturase/sphingolipid hydroxylase (fatty acid hydroxylase superfamily)
MTGGIPGALFILAIATAVEFVAPIERHSLRSRIGPACYSMVGLAIGTGCIILLSGTARMLGARPVISIPASGFGYAGDALALCASLVFSDFLSYWSHRFQHRFIWPIHALHHSPTQLNAASGYAHFGEAVFKYLLVALPMTFIQFQFPATPLIVVAMLSLLERYIHMPVDAEPRSLRRVLVTPRFHRIHHSLERRHLDHNFGILFSFWDRLFGTAYEPGDEWPAVGVANSPPPANLWQYLVYPLVRRDVEGPNFIARRRGLRASVQHEHV